MADLLGSDVLSAMTFAQTLTLFVLGVALGGFAGGYILGRLHGAQSERTRGQRPVPTLFNTPTNDRYYQ